MDIMKEFESEYSKVVLISISEDDATLDELERLVDTAGGCVVARMTQNREKPDVATYIGSGKAKELGEFIENNGDIKRRLQDIGLIPGTVVTCVQKSPCGDPVAYLIKGALIAIRCEDSDKITVEGCLG